MRWLRAPWWLSARGFFEASCLRLLVALLARLLQAAAQPPGVGPCLDDVGTEGESVDDCLAEAGGGGDARPLAEGQGGGDGGACHLVALGEDLEEQFGAGPGGLDATEVVELELQEMGQVVAMRQAFAGSLVGQLAVACAHRRQAQLFGLGTNQCVDGTIELAHERPPSRSWS